MKITKDHGDTIEINPRSKNVSITIFERWGGDAGEPTYTSITVTREEWERIRDYVESQETAYD